MQVNWLGFAGTTGLDAVDYILGDRIVLPFAVQSDYAEQIVHLPDSFFVNDSTRSISPNPSSRAEAGLPKKGLVFCCFNQSYKFSPAAVSVWMQLLNSVKDSVLWLSAQQEGAAANLRRAAQEAGVDPARLVFAKRVPSPADHLARHALADLFLDTWPYNAHATACDALFAGLPVLTFADSDFAGRVAASMLHAAGLPELVTESPEDYRALALALAAAPERLRAMRHKLQSQKGALPLFDTDRFRRSIEAAYAAMWERHQSGRSRCNSPWTGRADGAEGRGKPPFLTGCPAARSALSQGHAGNRRHHIPRHAPPDRGRRVRRRDGGCHARIVGAFRHHGVFRNGARRHRRLFLTGEPTKIDEREHLPHPDPARLLPGGPACFLDCDLRPLGSPACAGRGAVRHWRAV